MKIVRVKKGMMILLALIVSLSSCKKQDAMNERAPVNTDGVVVDGKSSVVPVPDPRTRPPRVPLIPPPLTRCIYNYQDMLDAIGTGRVIISKVVLASGATIEPGPYVAMVWYEAIPSAQSNSLFDSKLSVEWRFPDGLWQLSTANVWSLGCVYQHAGQPPYTNLIRGLDTILINTCFYWSTNDHTGERVDYLIASP